MKDDVIKIFKKLCSVPHGSGNTKRISDLVKDMALSRGLFVIQDEFNNLVIKKPGSAGREKEDAIILQAHLDMVAVKAEGSTKNMAEEGISVVSDGDYMWADGTSLGADDGIGVSVALAILFDNGISHPPLEVVFTVDEETHLLGAKNFDVSVLSGRHLINLDSEEEGVFVVSCAGGVSLEYSADSEPENPDGDNVFLKLEISGLSGGHSGVEIHHGRANANKLIFDILAKTSGVRISEISGGTFENVIPKSAFVSFCVPKELEKNVRNVIESEMAKVKAKYEETDSGMSFSITEAEPKPVISERIQNSLLSLVTSLPDGALKFSDNIPGFVETSLNLGIVRINAKGITIIDSLRSNVSGEKEKLLSKCVEIASHYGVKTDEYSEYPEWQYAEKSALREKCVASYEILFGKTPEIKGVHAGLECGIFAKKIKDLDAISMGPTIFDVHSVNEKLDIKSVGKIYDLLIKILEKM